MPPGGNGSPSLTNACDSRKVRPRSTLSPQRLLTYVITAINSSWLSCSPNAGMPLLKLGTVGSSSILPPPLTILYKRPSEWCHVCPSPFRGGAGSVPSALGICQLGCPRPSAPWQAAQVAAKISCPVREFGSEDTTLPDCELFLSAADEQANAAMAAISATKMETQRPVCICSQYRLEVLEFTRFGTDHPNLTVDAQHGGARRRRT